MKSNIDCKPKFFVQKIVSLNFVITILCFLILSGCGNTTSIIASVAPNNGKPAEPNFSQFGLIKLLFYLLLNTCGPILFKLM